MINWKLVAVEPEARMSQGSLFGPEHAATSKPEGDQSTTLRVLITVKAAPNPSATYGETVCVAGLRLDLDQPGWIRLYPINFRELENDHRFKKYDVVSVSARPARGDPRVESWKPDMTSLQVEKHLKPWEPRRSHVEPYIEQSMCDVLTAVKSTPTARSLAAIRPAKVSNILIERHPGWTSDEQRKIDSYVNQLDIFGSDRKALEAPRFKGWYQYRCQSKHCKGHRQGILDWEFVALQRKLNDYNDAELREALREEFFHNICAKNRDVVFYVGNQAKHQRTFSVLGVYYPKH